MGRYDHGVAISVYILASVREQTYVQLGLLSEKVKLRYSVLLIPPSQKCACCLMSEAKEEPK